MRCHLLSTHLVRFSTPALVRERLKMTTFAAAKKMIFNRLGALGIADHEARRECELIILHATGCDTAQQVLRATEALAQSQEQVIEEIVAKREARVPLQYCIGHTWFMGLRFDVEPGVLIPRADTEALVHKASQLISLSDNQGDLNVVDVGIGSGAIAVSLLKAHPALKIVGVDISETACRISSQNALLNGVADRLRIECGDWHELLPDDIDVFVSNPPYIPSVQASQLQPEVGIYEPKEALFGKEDDGLGFYRDFARLVPRRFRTGKGCIAVEVGDGQSGSVCAIFEEAGWLQVHVDLDMARSPRVVTARMS